MQNSDQTTAMPDEAALNVLIVEDEVLIAFDLESQIEALGHRVVGIAQDMASCKKVVELCTTDVALMDMRLKGGDCGEDVARWLRNELSVRCIFVSGNLDDARQERLRSLDPVAFVGKPLLPIHLAQALARVSPKGM